MTSFSRTCWVGNRSNQVHIVKNERSQARIDQPCASEECRWCFFPPMYENDRPVIQSYSFRFFIRVF